jgi:hypothetical protein
MTHTIRLPTLAALAAAFWLSPLPITDSNQAVAQQILVPGNAQVQYFGFGEVPHYRSGYGNMYRGYGYPGYGNRPYGFGGFAPYGVPINDAYRYGAMDRRIQRELLLRGGANRSIYRAPINSRAYNPYGYRRF